MVSGFCTVEAPSRLHLGFADLHGGLGRRFGGVGVALAEPRLELTAQAADAFAAQGPNGKSSVDSNDVGRRVRAAAERFLQTHPDTRTARFEVRRAIPEHCGFGSGTQTALAVGHALAQLNNLELSSRDLMRCMERGKRSGVGVSAFEHGGLIVDGGKRNNDCPPPLLARFALPADWRIVLITDDAALGVHGAAESGAFERLPRFSAGCAGYMSRIVLMGLLPSVAEGDFPSFADAVTRLQDCIGDYFSTVQGGRYASPRVGRVLEYLRERRVRGIGQSSWGPTGFMFAPSEAYAREWVEAIQRAFPNSTDVGLAVTCPDHRGGVISRV